MTNEFEEAMKSYDEALSRAAEEYSVSVMPALDKYRRAVEEANIVLRIHLERIVTKEHET